jgi:hypothetical protein
MSRARNWSHSKSYQSSSYHPYVLLKIPFNIILPYMCGSSYCLISYYLLLLLLRKPGQRSRCRDCLHAERPKGRSSEFGVPGGCTVFPSLLRLDWLWGLVSMQWVLVALSSRPEHRLSWLILSKVFCRTYRYIPRDNT